METMIAVVLMGLILGGTMDLFLTTTRTTASTQARLTATLTAANAMQRVMNDAREAQSVDISARTFNSKSTDAPDGTHAGMTLTYPPAMADTAVTLTTGTYTLSATNSPSDALYNRATAGTTTLSIYRADSDGTADPTAGQYLWVVGTEPGHTAIAAPGRSIARLADTATVAAAISDAVRFTQPNAYNLNEVEIRLVGSAYSPINKDQTSESTGTTELTAKAVLLRNPQGS